MRRRFADQEGQIALKANALLCPDEESHTKSPSEWDECALGRPVLGDKFERRHVSFTEGRFEARCDAVGRGHVRVRLERFPGEGPHKVTGA